MATETRVNVVANDDIWQCEERFWLDGQTFYRKHMDANAQMVFPDPIGILKGTEILKSLAGSPRWETVEFQEQSCIQARDTTVLAYRATGKRAGATPYSALCSSTYVRRDVTWMLISHQQTPAA